MKRRSFFTVVLSGLMALLGFGLSEETAAADRQESPRRLYRLMKKDGYVAWHRTAWHELRPGDRVLADEVDFLVKWTVGDNGPDDVEILVRGA